MLDRGDERFLIKAYEIDPWVTVAQGATRPCWPTEFNTLADLKQSISQTAWPVGIEIAIQNRYFRGRPRTGGCAKLAKDYGIIYRPGPEVRPLATRPPSELAAYHLFRCSDRLSVEALCKANALLGGTGLIRTHGHQTSQFASGHRSVFMPPSRVQNETNYLVDQINGARQLADFEFAVAAMIHTLIVHPFSDGNGRLARLVFQYCLFKRGLLHYPLLPLGPFIEKHRPAYLHALLSFSFRQAIEPFCQFLADGMHQTAGAVCAILAPTAKV